MQRKGLLRKVQESPPLWIITDTGREVLNKAASSQKLGGGLGASASAELSTTGIATGTGILSESEYFKSVIFVGTVRGVSCTNLHNAVLVFVLPNDISFSVYITKLNA